MVRVRKLSLSEWFTDYQLFYASKSLTHLPGTIDVDVTKLVAARNQWTSIFADRGFGQSRCNTFAGQASSQPNAFSHDFW